jgi:hypothetical protein
VAGTSFAAPYSPDHFNCGSDATLYFAFQSVTGLVEGGQVSSDPNNPCHGTVGVLPITVINVYIPLGSGTGSGGENGAVIDAFNEETGSFCDDTFVTVAPDSNGSLTNSGNVFGWVNSAKAETIKALSPISPSNVYFHKWTIVPETKDATDSFAGDTLTVGKNTNPYAFAFYGALNKSFVKDIKDGLVEKFHIKEMTKDRLPDKYLSKEVIKENKEFAGGEGDPYRDLGDPAYLGVIRVLTDKLEALEKKMGQLGTSFIKSQERPAVGRDIARKTGKRK